MLGVWATTSSQAGQLDRVGRPLTGNALLGTLATAAESDKLKEDYNRATPATAARFVPEIEKNLGLYDAFDGKCGNQWLASTAATADRYAALARLLADDRLWVDTRRRQCTRYMAVERAGQARSPDCGGRTPQEDAVDVYRALLVNGTESGMDDGVLQHDKVHSTVDFPFLAAP